MMHKNTAKGAASLYLSNLIALFVITGHFVVLTNTLSITNIGVIFGFQILMYLIATLATFCLPIPIMSPLPLPHAITKFIPDFIASGNKGKANTIFKYSLFLTIIISISILIIIFINIQIINQSFFNGTITNPIIFIALIQIFFFSLNQFLFGGMVAIGDSYKAGLIQVVSIIIRYTLAAVFAILGFGITGVLFGYFIGDLVFSIISLPLCYNKLKGKKQPIDINEIIDYSFPILISSLIIFSVTQIDRIFALINLGLPELGIYTIAIAASTIGAYAPNALATAITPNLAALNSLNKIKEFRNLSKLYTRYISFIGMPAAFMIASLSIPLTLIFGEQYTASAIPAAIISIAIGLTTFSSIYNSQLFVKRKTRWIMFSNIVGLFVFIFIILASQTYTGNTNVSSLAIGRASMVLITAILISYKSFKLGDMEYDKQAIINSLLGSIIMSVILFSLYQGFYNYISNILLLFILIPVGIIIYIAILRQTKTFNEQDFNFIVKIISLKSIKIKMLLKKILGIKSVQ